MPDPMTAKEFETIRKNAGLTIRDLAATLRYNDVRGIRRFADGDQPISGPVSIIMELIRDDLLPKSLYRSAPRDDDKTA